MTAFTGSVVEEAALAWLEAGGWQVAHGPDIAPDMLAAERADDGEVVPAQRLRDALARLDPDLPAEALEDALGKVTRPEGADSIQTSKAEVPALFATNVVLVVPDGVEARAGTLTAGREWFKPWRTFSGGALADAHMPGLQVVAEGLLAPRRFLDMRAANARGEVLGLSEDELASDDALETDDSVVKVLGDEILRGIARELVETVRNNVTIDWTLRGNVRAQLRVLVKRILRKYGYPPDKQEKATQTALEQAASLSAEWAPAGAPFTERHRLASRAGPGPAPGASKDRASFGPATLPERRILTPRAGRGDR